MPKIYIDSTLHHKWNYQFNPKLCVVLERKGVNVYLPQRDTNQTASKDKKFRQNYQGMESAEKLLVVAVNESPNWGVELGFCYGQRKPIIILTIEDHEIPLMGEFMATSILRVKNLDCIEDYINRLVKVISLH